MTYRLVTISVGCLLLAAAANCLADEKPKYEVTTPPAELKIPEYHTKYIDADGFPIVASKNVNDYALKEAAFLIRKLLAHRPDVKRAMVASGARLVILAHNEFTTDVPEFAHFKPKDYWDARARGTGGSQDDPYCSCGEENLLGYQGDPYWQENILIHEFAHNMHLRGMVRIDPTFDKRLKETYDAAMKQGLWKGAYASTNHHEYFAEGVQCWFDNNRENDAEHNHVNTRKELIEYDPGLAKMCEEVYGKTELTYTKPATRLTGHLEGYDPSTAPEFKWPKRLDKAREEIRQKVRDRNRRAAASSAEDMLTAMTWNIRYNNRGDSENAWPHRADWVADIIRREQPDVLGLQEVQLGQLKDLQESLPEFAFYGVGRDDGKQGGEHTPIFYRKDRLELLASGTFWLSPTPEKAGSKGWDAAITRIASWVKLKDKQTGQTFYTINTHFDHRGEQARAESAKLLVARLRDQFADHPVILMGDFNTTPGTAPYKMLTAGEGNEDLATFRDAITQTGKLEGPDSTWNGFREIIPGRRIDFIFTTAGVKSLTHRTLDDQRDGRFPSDHLPVVTTLTMDAK